MLSNDSKSQPAYTTQDPRTHTPENPFCFNPMCSCHENQTAIAVLLQYISAGTLTLAEATAIVRGKSI